MKEVNFCGSVVKCAETSDGQLCWPEEWTDELTANGALEMAQKLLDSMPAAARQTPWIIGSGTKDLTDRPRTESQSHLEGRAFDMSPLYDADDALPPDGSIMGMAWNVLSLMLLTEAWDAYHNFVVEGDHLHVMLQATMDLPGMPAAWTMPTWYDFTSTMSNTPVQEWAGTLWILNTRTAHYAPATADDLAELRQKLA